MSLGCPKNLTDTEVMIKLITDAGYSITTDETKADIIVVNTCAFIESAKRESIDTILDLSLLKENKCASRDNSSRMHGRTLSRRIVP